MSTKNVQRVQAWFEELWNKGREEAVDEMLAENGVVHGIGGTLLRGREAFKAFYRSFRAVFPRTEFEIIRAFAQDQEVLFQTKAEMTHAVTKKSITLSGAGLACFDEKGMIVEASNMFDFLDMAEQVGSVPKDALAQILAGKSFVSCGDASKVVGIGALERVLNKQIHKPEDKAELFAAVDELYAKDVISYDSQTDARGTDAFKVVLLSFREGFPDMVYTIDEILAEGDLVAMCLTAKGTHTGEFAGRPGSGRSIEAQGHACLRVKDGKIIEIRQAWDWGNLMWQIEGDVDATEGP